MKTKAEQELINKFIAVPLILVLVILLEKLLESSFNSVYIFSIMTVVEFSLLGYHFYILSKLININKVKKTNNIIER